MPMIKLHASKEISGALLAELSREVAEATGKPVRYVMAVAERAETAMGGEAGEAVYAEVKGIGGFDGATNRDLTARICTLLEARIGIPADRIYVVFESVPADRWGWNGSTFG